MTMGSTTPETSRTTPEVAPSQTVGPFFLNCLLREDARRNVLARPETTGERVRIEGRVVDGDGEPVPDAMVEIWQANAAGRYNHPADTREAEAPLDPAFLGFGRSGTDEDGRYWFETVKPGAVTFDGARMQAPHICVMVFARGLLNHAATRLYFADEGPANAADPVLARVPEGRRGTLIAARVAGDGGHGGDGAPGETVYRFDIRLQGEHETAFFNV